MRMNSSFIRSVQVQLVGILIATTASAYASLQAGQDALERRRDRSVLAYVAAELGESVVENRKELREDRRLIREDRRETREDQRQP